MNNENEKNIIAQKDEESSVKQIDMNKNENLENNIDNKDKDIILEQKIEEDKNKNIIMKSKDDISIIDKKEEMLSLDDNNNNSIKRSLSFSKRDFLKERKSFSLKSNDILSLNSINNENENDDKVDNLDEINTDKKNQSKMKSRSLTLIGSDINVIKKRFEQPKTFFEQLSENPLYKKLVDMKNDTDNYLKNTVGKSGSASFIRSLVSQKKIRFCYDGFDLDLTYITKNIIAMSFPSTSIESIYRNKLEDVKKFFNTRHPKHYKIYNLCLERRYPKGTFYMQGYVPMKDHEPPRFNALMPFCKDAKKFLEEDKENIIACHCLGGKGRTGTVICCLFLYLGTFDTADKALRYFGLMRVGMERGVSQPSQLRYIYYFEKVIQNKIPTPLIYNSVIVKKITFNSIPFILKLTNPPILTIENNDNTTNYVEPPKVVDISQGVKGLEFNLTDNKVSVSGDFLITFYSRKLFSKEQMFHAWVNTFFLEKEGKLEIEKNYLDKACEDIRDKIYPHDFKIKIEYDFV